MLFKKQRALIDPSDLQLLRSSFFIYGATYARLHYHATLCYPYVDSHIH